MSKKQLSQIIHLGKKYEHRHHQYFCQNAKIPVFDSNSVKPGGLENQLLVCSKFFEISKFAEQLQIEFDSRLGNRLQELISSNSSKFSSKIVGTSFGRTLIFRLVNLSKKNSCTQPERFVISITNELPQKCRPTRALGTSEF